jgi:hypothetical protein
MSASPPSVPGSSVGAGSPRGKRRGRASYAGHDSGAGVPRLTKMIDQVMVIPKRYRAYAAYVREHRSAVIRDHVAIADAIARHDPTVAGLLMAEHVRWTGKIAVDAQSS